MSKPQLSHRDVTKSKIMIIIPISASDSNYNCSNFGLLPLEDCMAM
jgi:hypothetical protein